MKTYLERDISSVVMPAIDQMPVVVVTGMRQTGKSTFLQREPPLRKRRYVTFDDFAQLAAAKEDPDRFVAADEPLTIDEAHKCPEVLTAIKRRVDRERVPGRFLLSGSANFAMLRAVTESLAGRAAYFTMHPLTRRERAGGTAAPSYVEKLMESGRPPKSPPRPPLGDEEVLSGGMPPVCLGEIKNRALWFKAYEQTYLERDIRQFSRLGDLIPFRNLLGLAALRTGGLFSPSGIGRDARINAATASRYLSLLEASFVAYRLAPFLRNRASRLIKSPKLFFSDSGLACHLAGVGHLGTDPSRGAMVETYVAQNLAGIVDARMPGASLFFWNVQGRHEVDFVVESGRRTVAIEVKSAARWNARDLAGLKAFLAATPGCVAAVLAYNGTETVPLGEKLWAVPLGAILS